MTPIRKALLAAAALACTGAAPSPEVAGDLVARWTVAGQPLVLRSRPEDAGAVSSLVFRGVEHVAGSEHGYLLQGAAQFGAGAECLNPTQAGSRTDGPGVSTSVRLAGRADASVYDATTRMAYWTPPGRTCTDAYGRRATAWNRTALSDTTYRLRLTSGAFGRAAALRAEVTFGLAANEDAASFEALTGYTPPGFDRLEAFDPDTRRLAPDPELNTHLAERSEPVAVSTADGRQAMAVLALQGAGQARYAAFHNAAVGKWSLVYHYPGGLRAGPHRYVCLVLIGSRAEVEAALAALHPRSRLSADLAAIAGVAAVGVAGAALVAHVRRRRRPPLRPLR